MRETCDLFLAVEPIQFDSPPFSSLPSTVISSSLLPFDARGLERCGSRLSWGLHAASPAFPPLPNVWVGLNLASVGFNLRLQAWLWVKLL